MLYRVFSKSLGTAHWDAFELDDLRIIVTKLYSQLEALMEHLGLEFDEEPAKDEKIVIKKKK